MSEQKRSLSYRDAGVDIDAGEALVERIKPHVKRTLRPEVLQGLGGFGALFELPLERYRKPVLVSGTDGVGTKLKLAQQLGRHDSIGVDLVAMCVNDVLVQGAEPLFFLDYFACGKLDVAVAEQVIAGIAEGCQQAGAALVGGETAEMPGMYDGGDYDLAGFCVGIAEKDELLGADRVRAGDSIIGLASTGPHSNGYSLIRKVIEAVQAASNGGELNAELAAALMAPTAIYVKALHPLMKAGLIHAAAHITGGGLTDNLPRVLPALTKADIDTKAWRMPEIFSWLQREGGIDQGEMLRTFNCGIGMTLVVDQSAVSRVLEGLPAEFDARVIGEVVSDKTASSARVDYIA